jgi:hypothetical protein
MEHTISGDINLQLRFCELGYIIEGEFAVADRAGDQGDRLRTESGVEAGWQTGTTVAMAIGSTVPVAVLV